MKSSFFTKSGIILLAATTVVSCNPLNKLAKNAENIKYSLEPNPLEMHGDSVSLTISGKYPPQLFPKKVTMKVTPMLKEAGENGAVIMEFTSVNLVGTDADGEGKKIDFDKGGSFNYNDKVAYKKAMENSVLELNATASFKTKQKELGAKEIGKGTMITSKLVKGDEKPIMAKDKFVKVIPRSKTATINYSISSAVVSNSELKDEDYTALKEFIAMGKEKNFVFKNVMVEAFASPDGEVDKNENLASDRAESANNALSKSLKKNKVSFATEDYAKLEGKGEDWNGFQKAMKASEIKDKDLILRILGMYDDVNRREKEIKNLAATYTEVADKILPGLRRASITIQAEERSRTDEQIMELVKSNPDTLSVEEMLYAATLTEDLNEKLAIYQKTSEVYSKDWRGFNNVGYIYMLQNKKNDAKTAFDKAANLNLTEPIIKNNLGVIARLEGRVDDAKKFYSEAAGAGPEVKYNTGIVNIVQGDYDAAKRNFGSTQDFNKALSQVMSGEAEAALKTLDASDDKETAEAYYLKAVVGARTSNKDLMVQNLKTAIKMDSSFRTKAQKDAEFIQYREEAEFKALF